MDNSSLKSYVNIVTGYFTDDPAAYKIRYKRYLAMLKKLQRQLRAKWGFWPDKLPALRKIGYGHPAWVKVNFDVRTGYTLALSESWTPNSAGDNHFDPKSLEWKRVPATFQKNSTTSVLLLVADLYFERNMTAFNPKTHRGETARDHSPLQPVHFEYGLNAVSATVNTITRAFAPEAASQPCAEAGYIATPGFRGGQSGLLTFSLFTPPASPVDRDPVSEPENPAINKPFG